MIYLRHLVASHHLDHVKSVRLITGDEAWIGLQVTAELHELFPGVSLVPGPESADLVVLADRKEGITNLVRAERGLRRSPAPVWLYAVDLGRIEHLASGAALVRWRRRQQLLKRMETWSRCHPARWRGAGDAAHITQQLWWKLGRPLLAKATRALPREPAGLRTESAS